MKKYKVITGFIDKETGTQHYTREVLELDPNRAKQLKGYVEEIPGQEKPKKEAKKNGK